MFYRKGGEEMSKTLRIPKSEPTINYGFGVSTSDIIDNMMDSRSEGGGGCCCCCCCCCCCSGGATDVKKEEKIVK